MLLIDLLKPLVCLLPEVESPKRKIEFREKLLWTVVSLLLFLVLSQIPLYGIRVSKDSDPLLWLRVLTASNRNTLMELGISPIITSGMVLQFLTGSNILKIDQNSKEDRMIYQGIQKLISLLLTTGQAIIYVYSGMYGNMENLGYGNAILIVSQLIMTGMVVILFDELLQKGYGLGSAISLFIAANICEAIVWKSFSPTKIITEKGSEFEGALPTFLHSLFFSENRFSAIINSFSRSNLPNMLNLFSTLIIFVIVIYFQGFKIELPIKHERVRSNAQSYPIKLFYTSNIPIILQTALVSNMYFLSKFLYSNFPNQPIVKFFGVWKKSNDGSGVLFPVWGLAYYLSPPVSLKRMLFDPFHSLFYISFVLATAAIFSKAWLQVSGSSSKDVARQFKNENMVVVGHRRQNTEKVLDRYIPISAAFGGMCIGALTIFADYMGAIGSGTGILLVVSIIFQYFEMYAKEKQKDGRNFLSSLIR